MARRNHEEACSSSLLLHLLPLLLFIEPTLVLLPAKGQQQQSPDDYVYGICNTQTYDMNSTFAFNLNTAVSILKQQAATGAKYYLTEVKEGSDNASWVYGTYQCRGDVTTDDCSNCLSSILSAGYCGATYGIRIQNLGCFYRYENYDFTIPEISVVMSNCSSQKNSSSAYQSDLTTALRSTTSAAATNGGGYAAATVGSAHALSQCLGYISESDCTSCLNQSSSRTSICNTSSSGFFYYISCYYLFSDTNLLFSNSTSSPPPATSPAPGNLPSGSPISPSPFLQLPAAPAVLIIPLSNSPGSKSSSISAAAIAGSAVGSALAIAVLVVFYVVCIVKRHRFLQSGAGPIIPPSSTNPSNFTVQELQAATESFDSRNKLGEGGFGVVYKGTLRNGKEVAIKIISTGDNRGNKIDFSNELKLITTVQHRNLIQLLGCATDDSRWYLVYEYLANKSLDLHLFGNKDEARPLNWKTRFNIITGIARGLCYLHEDSQVRIVHRDIKASNILLDDNLEPKIADFGLARLFTDGVSHLTTGVAGTLGYVAPEYAMGGQLSEKVDVYSFGLVMLEIVSGRKVIDNNVEDAGQTHILQWAWDLYERKQVVEIVDSKIKESANEWEVARAVHVALLCAQTNPQTRPSMSQVYMMLSSQSAIMDLPSRPGFISMGIFSGPQHNDSDQEGRNWSISSKSATRMTATTDSSGVSAASEQMVHGERRYGTLWWMSASSVVDNSTETLDSRLKDPYGSISELDAR